MDWNECLICQCQATEPLKSPFNTNGSGDKSQPYISFLINVNSFREFDAMPVKLPFGEEMTADELVKNRGCYKKFCKDKLERAMKKRASDIAEQTSAEKRLRRQSRDKLLCLFCQQDDGLLHEINTLEHDENLKKMAKELNDTELIARMTGGDLIALDGKYHLHCLTLLRNRHRSLKRQQEQEMAGYHKEQQIKARVLVELFTYVKNCVEDGTFFFKFSTLHQLYEKRLRDLGVQKEINRMRLKEKIMSHFSQAQEQSDGKNSILVFQQGMQQMLKNTMANNYEDDALLLAKTAKLVRREIDSYNGFHFDCHFSEGCQKRSVPPLLKTLISMLLNGADLNDQDSTESQANLTISQTILFNFKKRALSSSKSCHSMSREPPLPLYIGIKIHTATRSKKIITQLYDLGLCISYDRVLEIESQLAISVCRDFHDKGVVVPAQLRCGLFTVGALDNLDYNPSSTTAKDAFHGTAISLFQFPTAFNLGQRQCDIKLSVEEVKKSYSLPDSFTTVPAVAIKTIDVSVPQKIQPITTITKDMVGALATEKSWLEHAIQLLDKNEIEKDDVVTWSAFHASKQDTSTDQQITLTQLLPLFYEKLLQQL
jgi:hypothetical protein